MRNGLPKITLSEREREVIALRAQGHTDVAAVEQLDLSARCATNILHSPHGRLGVANPFAYGLALARASTGARPSRPARPSPTGEDSHDFSAPRNYNRCQ
jgi:DNA-binding NarL/FixJ family response regulator